MAQLWKSFVDALALPQRAERPRREGVALNHKVSEHPLSCREPSSQTGSQSSGARPERQEVLSDLNPNPAREPSARVAEVDSGSEEEFEDSREALPPRSLAESIAAARVPQAAIQSTSQPPSQERRHIVQSETGESLQTPENPSLDEGENANHVANLLEDVKYFHNAALGYQDMYETLQQQQEELQSKFKEQAKLVQEASEALKAVEAESSMRQQELVALQSQREADIQQAVGQAMFDYQEQLSLAQNNLQQKDREHQQSIQRLQDQVRALELSLLVR